MSPAASDVRVRFCPSPTGSLHVGNIRTALFVWAYARHTGGTFVFRIEDTDLVRSTEESYRSLLADMRWLGLDWDEGPEVGGPYGPYKQSERAGIYRDVVDKLLAAGSAYHCYCTQEEVEARNKAAGRNPGYDGFCRNLDDAQRAAFEAEGRQPVVRFAMPGRAIEFDDVIRGVVRFEPEFVPDYVLVRADGSPLYTLVNPVDDAMMGITIVLRGEDLLSSTPRQIALWEALGAVGIGSGVPPTYGHLPFVMGEGNKKLSKRDPSSSLDYYKRRGFLPEGLLNYLALLGWSMGEDREVFTLSEMVEHFELDRVSKNPARFDLKKCEAINADHMRMLAEDDLATRIADRLGQAGLVAVPPSAAEAATIRAAVPLVQSRMVVLADAEPMLGFLFIPEADFALDPAAVSKILKGNARAVLDAAIAALTPLPEWSAPAIEEALKSALVEGLSLKPRLAFGPVRVAITGRQVSPPLYESMELLGRERSLARLQAAIGACAE